MNIDVVALDRRGNRPDRDCTIALQALQRSDNDLMPIDFEESSQRGARVAAAETVGAQHDQTGIDIRAD